MRTTWLNSVFVLGVCLVALLPVHAQPLFPHAESIESLVANTDLVVIAKLVKFDEGKKGAGGEVHEATIDIEDTLKQDPFTIEPYTRMSISIARPASVLADWRERTCRLLVAVYGDAPKETHVIELVDGNVEVLKADMTLLRRPEDVIQAARKAVRRMPANVKRIHTFGLQVPRGVIAGTKWETYYRTGGHLVLSVPADKQLEKTAQGYVRSGSYQKRAEGARALRYFKSDENIALVQPLLDDRESYLVIRSETFEIRIFVVRHAASETLTSWGASFEQPIYREARRNPASTEARLTDADFMELARYKDDLHSLLLSDLNVTDEDLNRLAILKSLQNLELAGTKITDAGLKELAGIPSLKTIDLQRTQVTPAGVAELRANRPDLKIER